MKFSRERDICYGVRCKMDLWTDDHGKPVSEEVNE